MKCSVEFLDEINVNIKSINQSAYIYCLYSTSYKTWTQALNNAYCVNHSKRRAKNRILENKINAKKTQKYLKLQFKNH